MVASTTTNAETSSADRVNEQVRDQTQQRVAKLQNANLHDLTYRLVELDQEWDVDRVLQVGFGGIVLGGITLSRLYNSKWLAFPCLAAAFLMQQAVAGWCPPYLVLRRLGVRTAAEIGRERMALKVIRGDFAHLGVPQVQGGLTSNNSLLDAVEE
jgi:hypothetical protein